MKKLFIVSLLVLPMVAGAASSVRMLGATGTTASPATVQKITPTKNSAASTGTITSSRVGSFRAVPKSNSNIGAISGATSRFPVISPAHTYSSVTTPTSSSDSNSGAVTVSVDAEAIINAVLERVDNNYYNKTDVYNNNNFIEAVRDAVDVDDPRIDAIKIGSRPVHSVALPSDYVYMWIEE